MTFLALRGVAARKLRAFLTAAAIFFGVAMVAGTLILTDTINNSFDNIFASANEHTDVTVKPTETVEDSRGAEPPPFSADLLPKVQRVDGVEEAAGSIFDYSIAILGDDGKRIGPMGPPHIAASVVPERFTPWTYTEGRPPRGPDEVVFDNITAKEEKYKLGDRVRVAGPGGVKAYGIVGVGEFGDGTELGGASIAQFTRDEAQRLTDKEGKLDEILIAAKAGVSPDELKQRVRQALPPDVTVRTGAETADAESQDIKDGFSFLTIALLVFAGIALFVGSFLIFNTFSITVSQRTQEFGMLRTLGASARQVLASVLLEAVVIGLLASLIGLAGGIGFVALITGLFEALGFSLPTSHLVISVSTVIIALVVGLVSTTLASFIPAMRATRVTPLEALRDPGLARETRGGRRRTIMGGVLLTLGALLVGVGLFGTNSAGTSFQLFGPGLVLLFIGVAMLSNRLIRPIASMVGWPIERLRGVTGRLARENTLRNPSRTTTTAAALMIGVALVTFVATFASAISKSVDQAIDDSFAADLSLVNTDGFSRIPGGVAEAVKRVEGVETVSPVASADARIDGVGKQVVSAIDPQTIGKVANFEWREGSDVTLQQLGSKVGSKGVIAESDWAKDNDVGVGDLVTITTPTGLRPTYTVRGTARDEPGLFVSSIAIPIDAFARDFGINQDDSIFVAFAPGADTNTARAGVDRVLTREFPNVESRSQEQLKDDQREQINQLVLLIYALLALSIIISLFGVVNTLILTIHERTRELGMLRAIGTSKGQVRQMIRYESVITAMIGAILGATIGLVLAIVAVEALEDEGLVLSIPFPLLVVMLILAGVAGVAAAIAPARRASRLNVIEALQYE
jgi:putative ABC transport system permease protein